MKKERRNWKEREVKGIWNRKNRMKGKIEKEGKWKEYGIGRREWNENDKDDLGKEWESWNFKMREE